MIEVLGCTQHDSSLGCISCFRNPAIQNWQTGTLYAKREADSSSTTSGRCEQAGMSIYTDILTTTQFKWKPVVWAKVFKGEEHHDLLLMIYSWAPVQRPRALVQHGFEP